jgi:hypothetical protein
LQGITGTDTLMLEKISKEMPMILQMDYKNFGDKSLLVWEVFLGDG